MKQKVAAKKSKQHQKKMDANMNVFKYGQKEIIYLKNKDRKLGAIIEQLGIIRREITPDPFLALVSSIISQQISKKAAKTVLNRLYNSLGNITPENIQNASQKYIKDCGITYRKAGYIKGIAEAALSGEVNFDVLHSMDDSEIIKKLSTLKGVGVWTAEMFLIFSLCRPDVISYGDLGIRRGIMNLYNLDTLTKKDFDVYRVRYSPYASVASLYLWELSVLI